MRNRVFCAPEFNEEKNEIDIISLQDTKVEIDRLKLINKIKVNKILRKIVLN
jgi:hypothetical protein